MVRITNPTTASQLKQIVTVGFYLNTTWTRSRPWRRMAPAVLPQKVRGKPLCLGNVGVLARVLQWCSALVRGTIPLPPAGKSLSDSIQSTSTYTPTRTPTGM